MADTSPSSLPRNVKDNRLRHGMSQSAEYQIWASARKRTGNPTYFCYQNYGGRGIAMCDRWKDSFENFFADMGLRPNSRSTLERKDNSLGYSPENCVWASYRTQARNRRSNRVIEFRGESLIAIEWAKRYGMSDQVLCRRLKAGWTIERALTASVRCYKKAPSHCWRGAEDELTG